MSDGLRFRLYIGGDVVHEQWCNSEDEAQRLADEQAAIAAGSHRPWMVEVFNPDALEDDAYVRFGTDCDGMVEPVVVAPIVSER